ncbi:hypothetical protein ACFQ5N_00975 [Lutibacter holmesii]|uniref:Uncharacterized protein n=1 Tax=Lutibacter holmesii TaxID=1137985 RepID=A0ABW3WKH1_9FLAO
MIQFNGYYIEEPIEIYDRRLKGNKSSYSFNSFLFLKGGEVRIAAKHDFLMYLSDFKEIDFNGDLVLKKRFNITQNKIIIEKMFSFEDEITIEIIDSDKLYLKNTHKHLYFVSWDKVKKLESTKFENSIINNLFGPFQHKKFSIYYE